MCLLTLPNSKFSRRDVQLKMRLVLMLIAAALTALEVDSKIKPTQRTVRFKLENVPEDDAINFPAPQYIEEIFEKSRKDFEADQAMIKESERINEERIAEAERIRREYAMEEYKRILGRYKRMRKSSKDKIGVDRVFCTTLGNVKRNGKEVGVPESFYDKFESAMEEKSSTKTFFQNLLGSCYPQSKLI